MKKIPTLFKREFENHKVVKVLPEVTLGLEWVFDDPECYATLKVDGACTAFIDGKFYKRFDAKPGRGVPEGAIPCCEADPITGHWPNWVPIDENKPEDKWFARAYRNSYASVDPTVNATYEAVGPHFQKNPYGLDEDILIRHGSHVLSVDDWSFEGFRNYLMRHNIEGIVIWRRETPICKIKRSDFGIKWPGTGSVPMLL